MDLAAHHLRGAVRQDPRPTATGSRHARRGGDDDRGTRGKGPAEARESANERFKRSFDAWLWGSLTVATVIHFSVLTLWSRMTAESFSRETPPPPRVTELEVELPEEPPEITPPATPVVSEVTLDEDVTIARTTFEANPPDSLPPPPDEVGKGVSAVQAFAPCTTAPRVLNREEVQRTLQREYPSLLRDKKVPVWISLPITFEVH